MLLPATLTASTVTGMTICRATSRKSPPVPAVVMPLEGSQPSCTVKR